MDKLYVSYKRKLYKKIFILPYNQLTIKFSTIMIVLFKIVQIKFYWVFKKLLIIYLQRFNNSDLNLKIKNYSGL